jgi:hypothetical protein
MNLEERIVAFSQLGIILKNISEDEFQTLAHQSKNENPWFTQENVRTAIDGITLYLEESSLRNWVKPYTFNTAGGKKIGIVMAGNIPLVGFHDLLAVLMAGHKALIKVSSKDTVLIRFLTDKLFGLSPSFRELVFFEERLKGFDAVIATGSDNSARYFEYYFGKYPHIIRRNRTSVAILSGNESAKDLLLLGKDVFQYFGLGCRNVSKLFVPEGYSFESLFSQWEEFQSVIHHHKYANNYDYQKSILLVNGISHFDNGFILLQPSDKIVSPIAVLYYEQYRSKEQLEGYLQLDAGKIQCIVGNAPPATVAFGKAQYPELNDFADGINTLAFLNKLH